ncbi:uncharacterized protein VTP21DRAFT_5216 [Calcarisporiella thermophila]|uniref:uncharacterized protein n=1 Tax=Calcarisporiella thermophila TaxID=911321 RepID=UPI003741F725
MFEKFEQIGFIGLGSMGLPMACNVQRYLSSVPRHGKDLLVFNRTPSRADRVLKMGAKLSSSVEQLLDTCQLIFTSLADDTAVLEIFEQLLEQCDKAAGKVFVDLSTIAPETATKIESEVKKCGAHFLSCPVIGPPAKAESKDLLCVLSGPKELKAKLEPLFLGGIGRNIHDVGEEPAQAAKVKLIMNSFILGTFELVAEATTMAEASGIGGNRMLDVLGDYYGEKAPFLVKGKDMVEENYRVKEGEKAGFSILNALKDCRHILSLSSQTKVDVSAVKVAHGNLEKAKDMVGGDMDISAIVLPLKEQAGVRATRR